MADSHLQDWPVLKRYDQEHLRRIALPLGGIGTGTVSLGGRGDLRDWEIMNRPAKGFTPRGQGGQPFFALNVRSQGGNTVTRLLEGPLDLDEYEGGFGSAAHNHGLPRFHAASFAAAYPLGQVFLQDEAVPVTVTLQGFNPMVACDVEASSLPAAVLRFVLTNRTDENLDAAVCGSLPNYIGMDGSQTKTGFAGMASIYGAKQNRNRFHPGNGLQGVYMSSEGVDPLHEAWGTIALATDAVEGVSYRTSWATRSGGWGNDLLDFWEDFNADGRLEDLPQDNEDMPMASLAVKVRLAAHETRAITFLLTWHFPNRCSWTPKGECVDGCCAPGDRLENEYTTRYLDAWDAAEKIAPRLAELEARTVEFVRSFCESDLPEEVKEAALFNVSTLRTQTCFRTADGRFYAWEGCGDHAGCCHGSCTHVWNYEQATAFLFGELSQSLREVEFGLSTADDGLMSFRTGLPVERAAEWRSAAADGQMGCIMKMYRDWQLSGDDELLRALWPNVKKALAFCWVNGGWDADKDGVMEGCQHNTMDVEYFGPNPEMEGWYLGALRAGEEMARYLGDEAFAAECRGLFERGSAWTDANLFNGEYYEHHIQPIQSKDEVYPGLLVGMGARNLAEPDYQLGAGCLVDQLVGQNMAHVSGLGYLLNEAHVKATHRSLMKYNHLDSFHQHFNCLRSYVLGDEAGLLVASYPRERPKHPFPYFSEAWTGLEYTAAAGMIYEGQVEDALQCIREVRARYDGRKRNPFNEPECGHHYARAMAAWSTVLALTGFHYSGITRRMQLAARPGKHFWSTGRAWGVCTVERGAQNWTARVRVLGGELKLRRFALVGASERALGIEGVFGAGKEVVVVLDK